MEPQSYTSRAQAQELRVGMFALAGCLCFLLLLFTMVDVAPLRGRYHVTAYFEDAGGLRKGEPVLMRGVNIGRVRGLRIREEGVIIRLELQKNYPVPRDSRIVLRSQSVLGGLSAEIIPGTAIQPLREGDSLVGESGSGLMDQAGALGARADSVLLGLNSLLGPETVSSVGRSATELEGLLRSVHALSEEQRIELRLVMGEVKSAAEGIRAASTSEELLRSVARMDSLTAQTSTLLREWEVATRSLTNVLRKVEGGEGTLGRLVHDEALYDAWLSTARSMDALARDVKERPSRYVQISVF